MNKLVNFMAFGSVALLAACGGAGDPSLPQASAQARPAASEAAQQVSETEEPAGRQHSPRSEEN